MTTSNVSMTPSGGDAPAAATTRAPNQDEVKPLDLLAAVLAIDNLRRA